MRSLVVRRLSGAVCAWVVLGCAAWVVPPGLCRLGPGLFRLGCDAWVLGCAARSCAAWVVPPVSLNVRDA